MKKGKLIDNNKYYTFMFIPHSSKKTTSLKISTWVLNSILIGFTFLCILLLSIVSFNSVLNSNSTQQLNNEIASKNAQINSLLEELSNQQAEINYISNNVSEMEQLVSGVKSASGSINRGINASRGSVENIDTTDINIRAISSTSLEELKSKSDLLKKVFYDISGPISDINDYIISKPSVWPTNCKKVTSEFGYRKDPIYNRNNQFHSGIDIANDYGAPIYASGKGSIVFVGYIAGYGNTVIIDHSYGITSLYGHASKLLVKSGQKVSQCDVIAKVGSTGKSTGSHLHFEVLVNQKQVNPYNFLK